MRARAVAFTLSALTVLAESRSSFAQEAAPRALACRPTIACTAEIVAPGAFELEAGYGARRLLGNGSVHTVPVLLKFSALRWLQLQVGGNTLTFGTGDQRLLHLDDLQLIAKFVFGRPFGRGPLLALSAGVWIPTWAGQLGYERTFDAGIIGYASHDVGPIHADLNAGLTVWGLSTSPSLQGFGTLALSADAFTGSGGMLEVYGFSDAGKLAPPDAGVLAGFYYSVTPTLVLDAGLDYSMLPSTRVFTMFAGVTWLVGRIALPGSARPSRSVAGRVAPR